MIKPFVTHGIHVTEEHLKQAEALHLSKSCILARIQRGMPVKLAVTLPNRANQPRKTYQGPSKPDPKAYQRGLKIYHLPLEDIYHRYGKPGHHLHPERLKKW